MLYGITSGDVTTQGYPLPYAFSGSSRREETDISEILDRSFSILARQKSLKKPSFYRSLLSSFEIDLSSVHPRFVPMTSTSLFEEFHEEIIHKEMLGIDTIVRMPPVKEYTMLVRVKSIEKAIPRVIEPEGY